ncbi:DUF4899 domain-containing protein [Thermotoga sp. KOL6]|uniref:DUF4899 domain-containing protein n=1 Tax=Thermotoga sp. KOL6 TaxID=126741 RepID=UPI000C77CABA|nr:DUF4899 domain-containing protein [Thermotoga sp. KOL6]PLV58996.1 hypothetical protein AS005_04360 [Thermotoga sp. KOL6]
MDLYFVKFRATSKLTSEVVQGYFLGKLNQAPEYDFFVVPGRYGRKYSIDLNQGFEDFLEDFTVKKENAMKEVTEASTMTDEFFDFWLVQSRRQNLRLVGSELFRLTENGDHEALRVFLSDLLREWSEKVEVEVVATPLDFEDVSLEVVKEHFEEISTDEVFKILQREDLKNLPEVFPVLDPLNGVTIREIDVEEKIDFVILNYGSGEISEKFKKFLRERFGTENVASLPGKLISKEVLKGKNGNLYLLKVEFEDGIVGKALVSPNLKIKLGQNRVKTSDEEWMEKIGEILEGEKKLSQEEAMKAKKRSQPVQSATSSDFFLAVVLALLVMGILLVLSYLLFS